ncbi:MAG: hypothetical protein FJX75_22825 [Armatimonadetes bacterium]|nr:hypothetical protein [Armatimonadota bacterium]
MSRIRLGAFALACLVAALTCGLSLAAGETHYAFLDQPAEGEYDLVCPIPAQGGGELRLAFDVASTTELSYVSLTGGKVALFRVAGGGAKRVGEVRPAPAGGGDTITLQRREGLVRVVVAAAVVLDTPWEGPPGGKVGLADGSGVALDDLLLQPVVEPQFSDDFTREETEMADWTTVGGTFRNTMIEAEGADPARTSNPFSLDVSTDADAIATAGLWFWDTYRVSTSVKPLNSQTVGLCAYVKDDRNYVAFRWSAGDERAASARQLVLVRDGQERMLAEGAGGYLPGAWYRLELQVTPGRIEALVDRDPVLSANTDAFGQGEVGLSARKGRALFDDVLVTAPDATEAWPPETNPVFIADVEMAAQELFLPRGLWLRGAPGATCWHWGRFYDDATVTIPLEQVQGRWLSVLLRPTGAAETAQSQLVVANVNGQLALRAERGARVDASATALIQGNSPVSVRIGGDAASVWQGGRQLLTCALSPSATGREIGLENAASSAIDKITVTSSHFRDYTFSGAPTDWCAGKGVWDVTSRWPCQPGWAFLGGTGNQNPVLWTKHSYRGDIVAEYYGALRLDEELLGSGNPYVHPSDINLALCGDGKSLGTGYSFVLAGWNNTKTAILRNGKIVAETPNAVFLDPSTRDSFHHHWFRVRAEKLADRARFWVDGQLVLEYKDPQPLEGGRVGLWTFHNDLVVAQARLWYAEEEQPGSIVRVSAPELPALQPVPRTADATGVWNDFEAGVGEWSVPEHAAGAVLALDARSPAAGKSSLRVTNAEDGGQFTVCPVTTPFRASDWPILSFDYRLTPDVKLNFYLHTNGAWHALKLTADEPEAEGVITLGSVANVQTDGKWHHAEVDLLALLQAHYPQFKVFQVRQVTLCPPWESYTRCGMGGNGRGAQYWIDNFRIGPRQ